MDRAFWQGRRVVLTGHTGFKGSWLALWLAELGAEVTGYSLEPPSEPNLFEEAGVAGRIAESIHGDVRELDGVARTLERARPQTIFHLAAQSLVRRGYADPLETYSTNVLGTAVVLEAGRQVPELESVVVVTSDKCYDNLETSRGYRETDALGGRDPYSGSKGAAEIVTAAYRASFFSGPSSSVPSPAAGAGLASVRAGNVLGGGDWAEDRLVPDLLRGFAAGAPVPIRNPAAIRPWQHVLEPLSGYLEVAERAAAEPQVGAQAWNFGPDAEDERPVRWVAERLVAAWGEGAAWRHDGGEHPHEAGYLKLDSTKARAELGWRPRLPLPEALGWVVDWHRSIAAGADAAELTVAQIRDFEKRMAS